MNENLVSIIVPIYNSENYIQRCVKSLINQTMKNIEIILINDGSTDNTLSILNELKKKDSRISVITKHNGGVSSARNMGLKYSKGKYITFVDADDWCESNMIEKMYKMAENKKVDIVSCGHSMDDKHGKSFYTNVIKYDMHSLDNNEIGKILHYSTISYSIAKLYKNNIIKDNNIKFNENISMGEDALFVCDYLLHINSAGIVNIPGYHYVRCNNDSLSTKFVPNIDIFIENIWKKLDILYDRYKEFKKLEHLDGSSREINRSKMYIYNNYRKGCNLTKKERRIIIERFMKSETLKKDIINYKPVTIIDKI